MNKRYYKIEDGKTIFYNGGIIVLNDRQIINPTEEQLLEAGWMIYVEPPVPAPTPAQRLREAKDIKLSEIESYDESPNVNGIIVNGNQVWIPADKRAILKTSVDSYKALGIESITKVWEGVEYTATADEWLFMIAKVEVYASECYNTTARHKAAVEALDNIEDVEEYDFTTGYPPKPTFSL